LLQVPRGTGPPAITGGSTPGSLLSCSRGSWAGDLLGAFLYRAPRSFAFQWRRNGAVIAGATTSTRIASRAGLYSCRVTAANAAGGKTQRSSDHKVFPDTKITEVKIDHSKQNAKFSFRGGGRPTGLQC